MNFPSIEIYKEKSIPHAKIYVQLFDRSTETTILERSYIGDWHNPGFEFACQDSTLNCTINNALSQALDDVIHAVATNNPTLKREKQLSYDRFNTLLENYLTGEVNGEILNEAIPKSDSTINLSDCFQTITDQNQSKFVAFFIKQVSSQNFKQLTENKTDQNVQILTKKDLKDEGFLDEIPQTYAYLVKGVKYANNWFYEKSNVTYFQAESLMQGKKEYFNNLQKWNFFQENSTEFNSDFWETSLFEKVKDLKKDPDWEKYKDMYASREYNNRPFIGQYEIVARKMREGYKEYEKKFQNNELIPELDRMIKENDEFIDYYIPNEGITAVFPPDMNIVLTPILIKFNDGIERIVFLIFYKGETFQWTYPKLKEFRGARRFYRSFLLDEIEGLVDWNFSYDTLDDQNFWDNYVVKKENGIYKYMSMIK